MHKSGFVAVVGRPNVGKSTLLNNLIGTKISIVTSKPHTTRHAILGVLTRPGHQLVFIDTPGLEARPKSLMNRNMNRAATGALEASDLVVLVVEAGKWVPGDDQALGLVRSSAKPCVVVVNKIDRVRPKDKLLPYLQALQQRFDFAEIVPVSALQSDNLAALERVLVDRLPEQEPLYPAEMLTNRGVQFRAAEILREKLMHHLRQELPYGLGVEVSQLEENDGRLSIDAIIWVDRESHKGIVVGKGGELIKKIGTSARHEMQETFGMPVRLDSRVKVKKNWSDNSQALQQMGYDGEL